jgi:hypothetical protein
MRIGMIRAKLNRAAIIRNRFIDQPLALQQHAEVVIRQRVIRIDRQRPLNRRHRVVVSAEPLERDREVAECFRTLRLKLGEPCPTSGGQLGALRAAEDQRNRLQPARFGWPEPKGALGVIGALIELPERFEHHRKVYVKIGDVRIDRFCAAQHLQPRAALSAMMKQESQ